MMAREIYQDIQDDLADIDKKRKEKKYLKEREKALKAEFEEQLKNLTVSQGKVLVQLINRETGNQCYSLIKELKSPVAAAFWQMIAKRHGYDLKAPYLASENPELEFIVRSLEEVQK
jgi:Skp family chaperone for outer membrane proteins